MRFLRIFFGNLLITFAYAFITVPQIILNGGVTSFSLVLQGISNIDVAIIVDVLTVILIVISYIFLGKRYFIGALFSSLCYMALFNIFHWSGWVLPVPMPVGVVVAGVMVAAGYYFCISSEATAVSFDTIALILHEKNERFDVAMTMMIINIAVLLSGAATYSIMAVVSGLCFTLIQGNCLKIFLKLGGISQKK